MLSCGRFGLDWRLNAAFSLVSCAVFTRHARTCPPRDAPSRRTTASALQGSNLFAGTTSLTLPKVPITVCTGPKPAWTPMYASRPKSGRHCPNPAGTWCQRVVGSYDLGHRDLLFRGQARVDGTAIVVRANRTSSVPRSHSTPVAKNKKARWSGPLAGKNTALHLTPVARCSHRKEGQTNQRKRTRFGNLIWWGFAIRVGPRALRSPQIASQQRET